MRANFLQPSLAHTRLVDEDSVHSMPVAQMGNYQEYLKRMTPQLREIESQPVRQHMFGNPFKIDKVRKGNFHFLYHTHILGLYEWQHINLWYVGRGRTLIPVVWRVWRE